MTTVFSAIDKISSFITADEVSILSSDYKRRVPKLIPVLSNNKTNLCFYTSIC